MMCLICPNKKSALIKQPARRFGLLSNLTGGEIGRF
jgi:hypothetical protein